MTWQSVSGVLSFVGLKPIIGTSKRQGTIERFSCSAEFCAGQVTTEKATPLRYLLRSLGVPVKGAMALYGENPGTSINTATGLLFQ